MSASQAHALDAVAFQLAAALETYELSVARMVDTWLDMDLYHSVSQQVEDIRMYSAALPHLSVAWVELLIAHAELVHSLWRLRFQEDDSDRQRLAGVRAHHTACIERLHKQCMRMLSRSRRAG